MGGVKRTAEGIELSHRLLAILLAIFAIGGSFVGITAATTRAADRVANAATRSELRDSVKGLRDIRQADSVRQAQAQRDQLWYNRQTWLLVCKSYNNPEAFCKEPDPSVLQAGRAR